MAPITVREFRERAEEFLATNADRKPPRESFVWGEGADDPALFEETDREAEKLALEAACGWRAKRFQAGFGYITGKEIFGGAGLTKAHETAYEIAESRYRIPDQSFFTIGLGMVAPTIAAHATPTAAADLLPKMYRGEILGAQLFSEPSAGSDLASLQMKAEKDGDEWVVSGQKVWTSGAHYSHIGEVICRTDPTLPKHRGLTGFIVDLTDAAVEIRPLRQMTGGANFNEVFFNELRVPDHMRLGEVNDGWRVALTTLMNERAAIGSGGRAGSSVFSKLSAMAKHYGVSDDHCIRQELADLYIRGKVLKMNNQRAMAKIKAGELPGAEMSGAKLALTDMMRRSSALASSILGAKLVADTGEWGTFSWSSYVNGVPGMSIAGGTDEVLRNIIGERVLGLPKEPGIDTTSPVSELRVGTQRSV
ncbi:MAG: acyl-CoA dehydrogenase [Acidimicrobiales bacterium]|nr:acyl-CoA dehydrogenase [Acidimicrobiales bacterium]